MGVGGERLLGRANACLIEVNEPEVVRVIDQDVCRAKLPVRDPRAMQQGDLLAQVGEGGVVNPSPVERVGLDPTVDQDTRAGAARAHRNQPWCSHARLDSRYLHGGFMFSLLARTGDA